MQTQAEQKLDLSQFWGSASFTQYGMFTKDVASEGVMYLAEEMGAYWLLDSLTACFMELKEKHDFLVIKLKPIHSHGMQILLEDGNDNLWYTHEVEFTNFNFSKLPVDFAIWAARNEIGSYTLYLPSEH